MDSTAHDTYLETQVLTATPQKLRLMLIEGALRYGRLAAECHAKREVDSQWCTALGRCNDILTELFSSIREERSSVAVRVQSIYRFLLLQLASISATADLVLLNEVLEVLESERETWRQLCEQMPTAPDRNINAAAVPNEVTSTGMAAISPGDGTARPSNSVPLSQFSSEA